MALRLITIAQRLTTDEANLARLALGNEGIASYFEGETVVALFSPMSNATGGIKLQVAEEDAARAREILDAGEFPEPAPAGGPTSCGRCGAAAEPGFGACWSCGASLTDPEAASADRPGPASPAESSLPEDAEPLEDEPPEEPTAEVEPANAGGMAEPAESAGESQDELAHRAFRSAVIGLFVLPLVLTLYSVWLLLRITFRPEPLGPKAARRYLAAWAINLLAAAIYGLIFYGVTR